MKHRTSRRSCTAAVLMWSCVALFGARVVAQLEALLLAPAWLPDMDAWYSGLLPYYLLLPAQIALLMLMAVVAWNRRVRTGCFARANPRAAGALRTFAAIYFVVMGVRLGVNVAGNGAEFWREGAIPVAFHWVLALFVLVSGRRSEGAMRSVRMPADYRHQYEEADDVPHGDVPALAQPLAYGFGFGKQVRNRDAG
jgi:hypothetical protein